MICSIRTFQITIPLAIFLLVCEPSVRAQTDPPPTIEEALHHMSDLAGVIFIGEVTSIRHQPGQQDASGIVEIDFRIDQAVRGCPAAGIYTLREWAGLWEGGDQRYRIGQRLLMMLHSPGPAGISSPVDGMNGAIPIHADHSNSQILSAANASASQPLVADLRWVATRILRTVPYDLPSSSATPSLMSATTALTQQDITDSVQQTPISVVVGMLSSWQQAMP